MSVLEQVVAKLDNMDIVLIVMIGVLPITLGSIALFAAAPYAMLGVLTLGFLAWAGIRTGVLEEEKEDPIDALNRRYAEGELSEEEWRQRRDNILDAEVEDDREMLTELE